MYKFLAVMAASLPLFGFTPQSGFNPRSVRDAGDKVTRVEPLSWWTGMNTPLQLLVQGEGISALDVRVEGGEGVSVEKVHKADSPNYLFVDVKIAPTAAPGTYYLVFSQKGRDRFKRSYDIAARRENSADRLSFSTADMIYLLMPDRFANGDPTNDATDSTIEKPDRGDLFGRHGGDIRGMIDHLDYIADLGATALWSTPLLLDNDAEGSYHGYACADYYHIDPRFGSNELYRELVETAHEKEVKVIMDIVTNHCGTAHWWMKDLPFEDWIHRFPSYTGANHAFSTNMDPNAAAADRKIHESGWFVSSMPDMNLDNPFVLNYFKQWAVWWIEFANLDGLRVDTYPYNEKIPMSEWNAAILAEYPNFNIVGECWTSSIPQLAYWQGGNPNKDGFDSHLPSIMDFPLREAVVGALSVDNPEWNQGMRRIYDCLSHDFVYHDLSRMMIFAANHDTERVGDLLGKDPRRLKISMAMLATMRGFPQIFSGDEMMFTSADTSQGHGGLRVDFPGGWQGDAVDLFTASGRTGMQADLHDYTRTLFRWRKNKPVIHHGKTMHFLPPDNESYAYFRYDDSEAVFVFINNSDKPKTIPWSNYSEIAPGPVTGRDVTTGETTTLDNSAGVGPRQALVVEFSRR
jgi:glycosidase